MLMQPWWAYLLWLAGICALLWLLWRREKSPRR
jgi:hypothetical protein